MTKQVMRWAVLTAVWAVGIGAGHQVWAQEPGTFQVGGQVTAARIGELDATDTGIGARVAWFPSSVLGVEGEFNFFPGDLPDRIAVSSARSEGLFGVTAGPRLGSWRPFGRVRTGYLRVSESPEPFACILIYPPPLNCLLAGGDTLLTFDIGAGVEVNTPGRTFVRVDVGDRLVRYPGPSFDRSRDVHDEQFYAHDWRLGIGAGWRF